MDRKGQHYVLLHPVQLHPVFTCTWCKDYLVALQADAEDPHSTAQTSKPRIISEELIVSFIENEIHS